MDDDGKRCDPIHKQLTPVPVLQVYMGVQYLAYLSYGSEEGEKEGGARRACASLDVGGGGRPRQGEPTAPSPVRINVAYAPAGSDSPRGSSRRCFVHHLECPGVSTQPVSQQACRAAQEGVQVAPLFPVDLACRVEGPREGEEGVCVSVLKGWREDWAAPASVPAPAPAPGPLPPPGLLGF